MIRLKLDELLDWKTKSNRKPLILNGARQVGKSWLVKHFGNTYFEGKLIVINFEIRKDLHFIFVKNLDVKRIVFELELALNIKINIGKDLVFFDEIQFCTNALSSVRYFYEELPELHLIAAGSLLDFEFRDVPFPVGRVDVMNLYPLNFQEFLMARQKENLVNILKAPVEQFDERYIQYFEVELTLYMIVGGMPEAVANFVESNDLEKVKYIQDTLLYTYEQDFKKYRPVVNADCLDDIISNTVKLLGSQLIYSKLTEKFSNPTIKKGIEVLKTARILHSVQNVSVSGLPLTSSGKQFKIYFIDIGLLLRKSGIDYTSLYLKRELTAAFKGTLAEQFVVQQLVSKFNKEPNYWARTESGASSEVDFVIEQNGKIIPIEVKAGKSGSLKSLHYLLEHNPHIEEAIVYSNARYGKDGKINYLPLIFAGV